MLCQTCSGFFWTQNSVQHSTNLNVAGLAHPFAGLLTNSKHSHHTANVSKKGKRMQRITINGDWFSTHLKERMTILELWKLVSICIFYCIFLDWLFFMSSRERKDSLKKNPLIVIKYKVTEIFFLNTTWRKLLRREKTFREGDKFKNILIIYMWGCLFTHLHIQ